MGMPAHDLSADWTAEMAIALPADGNRYEVLDDSTKGLQATLCLDLQFPDRPVKGVDLPQVQP